MNVKVLVALITSATSIIIALVAFINSRKTAQNSKKAGEQIERLRFELQQKGVRAQIVEDYLKQRFVALDEMIKHIQIVKDALILINSSIKNSLDVKTAKIRLETANSELIKCYENVHSKLDAAEDAIAHTAKNRVFALQNNFIKMTTGRDFINLSEGEKTLLFQYKIEFSDYQNTLRDAKYSLLIDSQR